MEEDEDEDEQARRRVEESVATEACEMHIGEEVCIRRPPTL